MELKPVVYLIVHKNSGKFYVGSTSNFKRRRQEHIYSLKAGKHNNENLQKLYNDDKNLVLNFYPFEVDSTEKAKELEELILKESFNNSKLLNIATSSNGGCGINKHPNRANIISKIAVSRKRHWENLSEEEKARRIRVFKTSVTTQDAVNKRKSTLNKYLEKQPHERRKQSPESIAKRVIKLKGLKRTQEVKDKISRANLGKKRTEQERIKLSVIRKEYYKMHPKPPVSAETREKLRQANLGKKVSIETKEKLSKINIERHAKLTPEERKLSDAAKLKISQKNKGKILSPEHRQKLRLAKLKFLSSMTPEQLKTYKDRLADSRKKA